MSEYIVIVIVALETSSLYMGSEWPGVMPEVRERSRMDSK